jgi:hypothetical protein
MWSNPLGALGVEFSHHIAGVFIGADSGEARMT